MIVLDRLGHEHEHCRRVLVARGHARALHVAGGLRLRLLDRAAEDVDVAAERGVELRLEVARGVLENALQVVVQRLVVECHEVAGESRRHLGDVLLR